MERGTYTEILMSILALIPLIGLIVLTFFVCMSDAPFENPTEIGILFGVLGTLCKDSYGYFFGSSKSGNSTNGEK